MLVYLQTKNFYFHQNDDSNSIFSLETSKNTIFLPIFVKEYTL